MNEKGLLAYYNVLLVFLISISFMVNFFKEIIDEKNMILYEYELVQLNYIENYKNNILLKLNELDEVPRYIKLDDYLCEITTVDSANSVYSFRTRKSNFIPYYSEFYNAVVTFKFIKGNCKIIKMEVGTIEQV